MKKLVLILIIGFLFTISLTAQITEVNGKMRYPVVSTGSGRVFLLSTDGTTKRICNGGTNVHDVWSLSNGNVLVSGGNIVAEYNAKGRRVFKYKSRNQVGGGTFSAQRLENGNTVISENSTGKILEVDQKGKILFSLQTSYQTDNQHHHLRMVRKLANGNYLTCHSGDQLVREYRADATVAWEINVGALAFAAVRKANGNTLISTMDHITEYNVDKEIVWQLACSDLKPLKVHNMTGFQLLPDGNLLIGCYDAYGDGAEVGIFEVNREKKVIWYYSNPKGDGSMLGVQMLFPELNAEKGDVLR